MGEVGGGGGGGGGGALTIGTCSLYPGASSAHEVYRMRRHVYRWNCLSQIVLATSRDTCSDFS